MDILELKKSGDRARLMPVGSLTNHETRATSIFLATLKVVEGFANSMLTSVGQRIGTRANIECYTEIVLPQDNDKKDRPDGLIVLNIGKRRWTAFIEAKIGNAELEPEQITRYLALAKQYKIDAVITISNQFAALPTHHPIKVTKTQTRSVDLYHWSWAFMLTQAVSQLKVEQDIDPEQRYILEEMVRYFEDPSSGVKYFDSMNKEWKEICVQVKNGEKLLKTSDAVQNTLGAWHQEQRDISLSLTRDLGEPVSIKMKKAHKNDPEKRLKDGCNDFVLSQILKSQFEIPKAASVLDVNADLARRTISCSMELQAHGDKQTTKAKVNWLVKQLKKTECQDILISARWPSSTKNTTKSLQDLKENPLALQTENKKLVPSRFIITLRKDLAGKFSGSRTFLDELNKIVPKFYKEAGEHLRAWVPSTLKLPEVEDE